MEFIDKLDDNSKLILGGAILLIIGPLLPWLTMTIIGTKYSVQGIDGDGKIILLLGLVIGFLVYRAEKKNIGLIAMVTGLLTVYCTGFFWGAANSILSKAAQEAGAFGSFLEGIVTIGIGLYLTLLGGIILTYGGYNSYISNIEGALSKGGKRNLLIGLNIIAGILFGFLAFVLIYSNFSEGGGDIKLMLVSVGATLLFFRTAYGLRKGESAIKFVNLTVACMLSIVFLQMFNSINNVESPRMAGMFIWGVLPLVITIGNLRYVTP